MNVRPSTHASAIGPSWTNVACIAAMATACASSTAESLSSQPASVPASLATAAVQKAKLFAAEIDEANCAPPINVDMEGALNMAQKLGTDVSPFLVDNTAFETAGLIRVYKGAYKNIGAGTKFGLMDAKGNLVVPFQWDFIGWFCGDKAPVCTGCTKQCAGSGSDCEHWSIVGGQTTCIDPKGATVPCD